MKITKIFLMVCVMYPAIGFCQPSDHLPPRSNSIYSSITGVNSEPEIFQNVSLSSFQLLTASLKIDKQKIVFSPLKLSEAWYGPLSTLKLNIAQENKISTAGIGVSFGETPSNSPRASEILSNITSNLDTPYYEKMLKENDKEAKEIYFRDSIYIPFIERLSDENKLLITVGGNAMLFDVIGGEKIDSDFDGKIDNEFWFKGYDLSLGIVWTPMKLFGINTTYHYTAKRASSIEGQELAPYYGVSLAFGYLVFILDNNYRLSKDYLDGLFIPSIVSGISLEYQKFNGDSQYSDNNIREILALTPFLDVKITPKSQFRVGIPINFKKLINAKAKTELNTFLQFSIQFTSVTG
jgi:hypothetical protein